MAKNIENGGKFVDNETPLNAQNFNYILDLAGGEGAGRFVDGVTPLNAQNLNKLLDLALAAAPPLLILSHPINTTLVRGFGWNKNVDLSDQSNLTELEEWQSVELKVVVRVKDKDIEPQYQWQMQQDGGEWQDISGATADTYIVPTDTGVGEYNYKVKISAIDIAPIESNVAEVKVRNLSFHEQRLIDTATFNRVLGRIKELTFPQNLQQLTLVQANKSVNDIIAVINREGVSVTVENIFFREAESTRSNGEGGEEGEYRFAVKLAFKGNSAEVEGSMRILPGHLFEIISNDPFVKASHSFAGQGTLITLTVSNVPHEMAVSACILSTPENIPVDRTSERTLHFIMPSQVVIIHGVFFEPVPIPVSSGGGTNDDNLYRYFDITVRNIVINGSPDASIPVLDPLVIDRKDIDINQDGLVLCGYVENVVVTGLSNFKIVSVQANETSKTAKIDISLDSLKIFGEHYVFDGNIDGVLPIWGEGAFQIDLNQLTLGAEMTLGVRADGFLEIGRLFTNMGLGSGTVNFENLLDGGSDAAIANDYISQELPNLLQTHEELLLSSLDTAIRDRLNEFLKEYTFDDLLALINSTPR